MSSTKFTAILPLKSDGIAIHLGDKVQIKGRVSNNAEQFSINFVNETCPYAQNITYHFKWILEDEVIVENNKQNGQWINHLETDYGHLNGRLERSNSASYDNKLLKQNDNHNDNNASDNDNKHQQQQQQPEQSQLLINSNFNSLLLGQNFALEFAFTHDGIYVYVMYDADRNFVTRYEPDHDLSSILALQVWGDVEKINELSFLYA